MSHDPQADPVGTERSPFDRALSRAADELLGVDGVFAVGRGQVAGEPCIVVLADPRSTADVPSRVDGYPVIVRTSDEVRTRSGGDDEAASKDG